MRNPYNQVQHLAEDTVWKRDQTQENLIYKRAKRSARLQQTDKTVRQRQTQITKMINKRSIALGWPERKGVVILEQEISLNVICEKVNFSICDFCNNYRDY